MELQDLIKLIPHGISVTFENVRNNPSREYEMTITDCKPEKKISCRMQITHEAVHDMEPEHFEFMMKDKFEELKNHSE